MKKILLLISFVLTLASCSKENPTIGTDGTVDISKLIFDISINRADDTKAVKSRWEKGDKVFFFFEGVSTGYVTTEFDGSGWTPTLNGTAALSFGGKKLTAVYFPYGAHLTASFNGAAWTFSETQYSYYLVAENVSYTISDVSRQTTLYATVNMKKPDGFVHFSMADASASDGAYTLATDAVIPTGLASVGLNGVLSQTNDKIVGNPMTGYKNGNGYSFSGKLSSSYLEPDQSTIKVGVAYYFIKTRVSDGNREDYFSKTEELKEHMAVVLPANGSEKWIAVGPDKWVDMGNSEVYYATCNYKAAVPEDVGQSYTYRDALALGVLLPTKDNLSWLGDASISWTWMRVNGRNGLVLKSNKTNQFLFWPASNTLGGFWWSSTLHEDPELADEHAVVLEFFNWGPLGLLRALGYYKGTNTFAIRPVQKK